MVVHRSHPPSPAIASGPLHPPTHTLEQESHVPVTMLLYNRLVLSLKHALSVEGDKLYCQVKVCMDGREVFKGRYIFGGPHACEHLICLWWYKYTYNEMKMPECSFNSTPCSFHFMHQISNRTSYPLKLFYVTLHYGYYKMQKIYVQLTEVSSSLCFTGRNYNNRIVVEVQHPTL